MHKLIPSKKLTELAKIPIIKQPVMLLRHYRSNYGFSVDRVFPMMKQKNPIYKNNHVNGCFRENHNNLTESTYKMGELFFGGNRPKYTNWKIKWLKI